MLYVYLNRLTETEAILAKYTHKLDELDKAFVHPHSVHDVKWTPLLVASASGNHLCVDMLHVRLT